MTYLTQLNQIMFGIAVTLALILSPNAYAESGGQIEANCKKHGPFVSVCTFIDDFGRECTIYGGQVGVALQCRHKESG